MPTDNNQGLLDKIQTLIDLGVGDSGRLDHIKNTITLGKKLYVSDKTYLDNILQKHSLVDPRDDSGSSTLESKIPEITSSDSQTEPKTNENITSKTNNQTNLKERKGLRLTTILAFLIMGVGHIYVGKTKRGVILLIIGLVLSTLSSVFVGIGEIYQDEYLIGSDALIFLGIAGAMGIAVFILWIWQIFNARSACREYNAQIR